MRIITFQWWIYIIMLMIRWWKLTLNQWHDVKLSWKYTWCCLCHHQFQDWYEWANSKAEYINESLTDKIGGCLYVKANECDGGGGGRWCCHCCCMASKITSGIIPIGASFWCWTTIMPIKYRHITWEITRYHVCLFLISIVLIYEFILEYKLIYSIEFKWIELNAEHTHTHKHAQKLSIK